MVNHYIRLVRKCLLTALLLLVFLGLFAQNTFSVKGKVLDAAGDPVIGCSILEKGTTNGAVSDTEGKFSLNASSNGTLLFSYIGFVTQEVAIESKNEINITLDEDRVNLQEVVVIGYETVNKRDVLGSVSSVSSKQFKDVPISNAGEAIQGRLAGVQILSSEGAPGADILVRVRGGGSITQDNSPLYIVDGVQVENALTVLAPQDIATIDVLKDASTTSIYGARAANGVVIITTKNGVAGRTQVSVNSSIGYKKLNEFQDVMQPYDFVRWQYERSRGNPTDSASFANTFGRTWDTLSNYNYTPFVNWQDEVFGRKANFSNNNFSINGGTSSTSFNLSFTANKELGVQINSGFNRNLVNFKIDHKVGDKAKVGFSTRYLDQEIDGQGTTNSGTRTTNRLRHAINYRPFELERPGFGIDEFDEAYFLASAGATNPVILSNAEYRNQQTRALYFTGYINYTILKNLSFRSTIGYDNGNIESRLFYSKITSTARNFASLPTASIGNQNNRTLTNSNILQYSLSKWKKNHDISILAGQEIVDVNSKQNAIETRYFPADISPEKALANMGLGSVPTGSTAQQPLPTSFEEPPARIASFFGRLNYGFKDKYLLNMNLRADRSSKFSSDNGTLLFPSASFAWRFTKESMFSNIDWLSEGKLRFGYGSVGNNRIGNLLYRQLYGVTGQYAFNHSVVPGFAPSALANPTLRWEENITRNLGLDISLFKEKIQLTIDAYKNTANDLLLQVAIPPTTGYATQLQNVGATSNRGIEFQVNAYPINKKKFSWTTNFNMSFNRNRVESLGGVNQITRNSGWQGSDGVDDYLVKVGEPVGLMYGFVTDGFFKVDDFNFNATTNTYTLKEGIAANGVYGTPQPGMLKWKDLNGDKVITADGDRQVIGNANPDFIGGWNNQFNLGNFDLSVFVNFVVGNDIYNANKIEWTDGAFANLNMLNIMKDRWTNINDAGQVVTEPTALAQLNANAKIWSPVRVQRWWLHSWAVEDGSYLRINNVSLGYTLPRTIAKRIKASSLRVCGTANNLYTFTKYSGYDPDVTARRSDPLTPGVDFAAYPRSTTYLMGVNLVF